MAIRIVIGIGLVALGVIIGIVLMALCAVSSMNDYQSREEE